MDAQFWLENFGPVGMLGLGFVWGWMACFKFLVKPDRKRLEKTEEKQERTDAKLDALNAEIREHLWRG